jgi:hypothetical protein
MIKTVLQILAIVVRIQIQIPRIRSIGLWIEILIRMLIRILLFLSMTFNMPFFCSLLVTLHLYNSSKMKSHKEVTK